ncbi:MAG: trigger factor [Candidatus Zambryskibacteria bacterium]
MPYEVKIKKLPKSEVEMGATLPADFLVSARKKAIGMFSTSLDIAGFRKGHVPENIVVEKIGEDKILEEATDILLKEHFPKIMEENKLDIIGHPKISITKLALGNPVEFKAVFAVMPEFELPDYRKIAASSKQQVASKEKREDLEAGEEEIENVLLQIRKNKAHFDYHEKHPEDKTHNHEIKDEDLPVLDDEFAKMAGNFKNLDELKNKVKENIIAEKKIRNIEKKRAEIIEELLKNTKIEMPEILIESETQKSLAQMEGDVESTGNKWEEYLSQVKKTEDDLKKDLRESSEKKAKIQLIFNKIAEVEKLEPNKEILENEVKEVLKYYPNASEQNARIYVATILLNSEVLKLLEK